jgi:hypothetical protein
MAVQTAPEIVWCQRCREHVIPTNLRPWPGGTLAIGECPRCHAALAVPKPVEWDAHRTVAKK